MVVNNINTSWENTSTNAKMLIAKYYLGKDSLSIPISKVHAHFVISWSESKLWISNSKHY